MDASARRFLSDIFGIAADTFGELAECAARDRDRQLRSLQELRRRRARMLDTFTRGARHPEE